MGRIEEADAERPGGEVQDGDQRAAALEWLTVSPTFDRDGVLFALGWGQPYQETRTFGWTSPIS